jgi:hypothetical protein
MMFRKLIGSNSMKNLGLITTKWDTVSKSVGEGREDDLKGPNGPWRQMIVQGTTTYRMDRSYESGYNFVNQLLRTEPTVIKLQEEMAKEFQGKPLPQTEAGQAVLDDVKDRATKGREDIKDLEDLLATKGLNQESIEEFQESLRKAKARVEQLEKDIKLFENTPSWGRVVGEILLRTAIQQGIHYGINAIGGSMLRGVAASPTIMESLKILGGSVGERWVDLSDLNSRRTGS